MHRENEWIVRYTPIWYITALTSVLGMYSKCSKEHRRWTEMRDTAFCLQRISRTHKESEWNTHKHTFFIKQFDINSGSLPGFGMIAFTSAVNCTGVHMKRTPDHPFYADLGTVHGCAPKVRRQHSHHPNEPNSDVIRTQVCTKGASVKAP